MKVPYFLSSLQKDTNDIFGQVMVSGPQASEHALREKIATQSYNNYLHEISKHHSIEVMDREIELFLTAIPRNGVICDVGGGWGWHWRKLYRFRPDVNVVIVDFCKSNLHHAKNLLKDSVGKTIWLVHGDATRLEFDSGTFDGYWSVQTLQHIPDFEQSITEALRVLKAGGVFANYSLNYSWPMALLYHLLRRQYSIKTQIKTNYYLNRADRQQGVTISHLFNSHVVKRYSEILFKPGFKCHFPGKNRSWWGKLDALMSSDSPLFAWMARQRSFHTKKPLKMTSYYFQ